MSVILPPAWLQNLATHTAETDRSVPNALLFGPRASNSLVSLGGVNPMLGGGLVVVQHGTPNMSVDVSSGTCMVPGSEGAKQGVYTVVNDATVTLTIAASDPTNPRIDIVSVQVRDQVYSGSNNDAQLVVTTGVPAGSPVAPTPPADSTVLAQVRVNAGVTSVTNANITDVRNIINSIGGTLLTNSTSRPTLSIYEGLMAYERDTNQLIGYDGAAWQIAALLASWKTYSPTWTGGSPSIGNGTLSGSYIQLGKLIVFRLNITGGSTTNWGTTAWTLGLPVASNQQTGSPVGIVTINDSSVTTNRQGPYVAWQNGTSSFGIGDTAANRMSNTVPITFATGDQVSVVGCYEAQ